MLRSVRLQPVLKTLLGVVLASGPALAEPIDDGAAVELVEPPTRSALTVAATPILSLADFCGDSEFADKCSSRGFVGFEVGGRVRVNERWALGPFLRYGWEAGSRGVGTSLQPGCIGTGPCPSSSTWTIYTSQLGAAGLSAHFHPGASGFWMAPSAGALLLRDVTDMRVDLGPTQTSSSFRWGAELGGGLGHDWHLSEGFALTVAGRVAWAFFPGAEPPQPLSGRTASSGPLVALAVGGWFGLE